MSYNIEIRLASKSGWHTPAEAKAYYGRYARDGLTVHWWGSPSLNPDKAHDNIVNYILGGASRGEKSVNYVLSNKKITLLVNPDNVAWASQGGNPTTVSCEFSPNLNAEGYKKAGWLINELFNTKNGRYKKAPKLWKHSDWVSTQCPGTLDLGRMLTEAKKWASGGYDPKPTPKPIPKPQPEPKPPTPSKLINQDFKLWKDGGTYKFIRDTFMYDLTSAKTWGDVKNAKAFKKGELIQIAGSFHNNYLDRDYYITKYSFDLKKATGFNAIDLEPYKAPTPKPPVPPEKPSDPVEPTEPAPTPPSKDEQQDARINVLEGAVASLKELVDKLIAWITSFKK